MVVLEWSFWSGCFVVVDGHVVVSFRVFWRKESSGCLFSSFLVTLGQILDICPNEHA